MSVKGKNPFRTPDALWEFLASADDDLKRGDHDKILLKIARQLDIPTDSTEARIALASCLLIAGQLDQAEDIARELLAFEETAVSGHLMLAAIHLERNEEKEALAEARAAITEAPDDIMTLTAAGDIMIGAGTFREAENTARKALSIDPQFMGGLEILTQAVFNQNRFEESLDIAEKGTAIYPDSIVLLENLAGAASALDETEKTEKAFRALCKMEPEAVEYIYALGATLYEMGRIEEARQCFDKAQALAPEDQENLAADIDKLFAEGPESVDNVPDLDSDNVQSVEDYAALLLTQGNEEEAIPYLKRTVALGNDDTDIVVTLIMALLHAEQSEDAYAYMEPALEKHPDDKSLRTVRPFVYLLLGQFDKVVEYMKDLPEEILAQLPDPTTLKELASEETSDSLEPAKKRRPTRQATSRKLSKTIFQIKVSLKGMRPPVWRRILVPGNITLPDLDNVIQTVMGWGGGHLHVFLIDGQEYDMVEHEGCFGFDEGNKRDHTKLCSLVTEEKSKFSYIYDFGDNWEHILTVEKITEPQEGLRYPVCIKGKRACPPEDIGGVGGYMYLLQALKCGDPDEEMQETLDFVSEDFDPEDFHVDWVNEELRERSAKKKLRD